MNRTVLTYSAANFTRVFVYLGIAIVFVVISLMNAAPTSIMMGFFALVFVVVAIADAGFVIRVRYFLHKISFDETALYISKDGGEQTILLKDILSFQLTGMGGQGIRGTARVYELRFQAAGGEDDLLIAVYHRNNAAFWRFQSILERENPSAEISNSWTSLDGLFNLFRKRKDH